MRRVLLVATGLAGFALAVVPALGSDKSIGTNGTAFTPPTVTVTVGDTVTISNTDGGNHNLHWDDRMIAEQFPGAGWTSQRTFNSTGSFGFYCDMHQASGMTGTVVVEAAGATTTAPTETQTQPATGTTTTSTSPSPATTTDTTPTATTTTTPSQTSAAVDKRAPSLAARAGSLRRKIQLAFTLSERARIVAVIRGRGVRTTVRFVLVPGNRTRVLLHKAKPGRYTITLTATDEAGNRARTVRKTVRVR